MSSVQIEGQKVTFFSDQPAEPGQTAAVSHQHAEIQLCVEHCRPLSEGGFVVVASADEPIANLPSQSVLGDRRQHRVPERLRVMSLDLPGYQALSVDCSLSGLQLETQGPIERGTVLFLHLSLLEREIPCRAQVVWCRPHTSSSYRVGCRFLQPGRQLQSQVTQLLGEYMPTFNPDTPPPPQTEERAKLEAQLTGYEVLGDQATLQLEMVDGRSRPMTLSYLRSLTDCRGRNGSQIATMALEQGDDYTLVRLLSPSQQLVMEFELSA